MSKFTAIIASLTILLYTAHITAQDIVYTAQDSIFIEATIAKHPRGKFSNCGERAVAIANELLGQRYIGGTLDRLPGEPLFISTTELDCTTFMELVTAMAICNGNNNIFRTVCRNIERIRYRNGMRNGYESRLHYISWWIDDCAKRGIIEEVYSKLHTAEQHIELEFMSRNSDKYPQLKKDPTLIKIIDEYEKPYRGKRINYIPKELLTKEEVKKTIKEGDILAIVTSIKGLDVTHVGIAHWIDGELHMIHASNIKKTIISDNFTLYEYMKRNKHHSGIRIFRLI